MTSPDLDALEHALIHLDNGLSLLPDLIVQIPDDDCHTADALHYLARALKRDVKDVLAWFDATHEAQHPAKATGPVAVT